MMILIADSSEFLIETKVDNLRETVFEIGPNSCNNIPKKVFAGDEVNHTAYFVMSMIVCWYERRDNMMGKEPAGMLNSLLNSLLNINGEIYLKLT